MLDNYDSQFSGFIAMHLFILYKYTFGVHGIDENHFNHAKLRKSKEGSVWACSSQAFCHALRILSQCYG